MNNFLDISTDLATPDLHGDKLVLPTITASTKSPLKGFLDISSTFKKVRHDFQTIDQASPRVRRQGNQSVRHGDHDHIDIGGGLAEGEDLKAKKRFRSASKKKDGPRMSPKVLETWVRDTLYEAEHLDIPGVIMKPENRNPMLRYGVDTQTLQEAGVPQEAIERIYRSLFVYSVGFYEMLKKILTHVDGKFTVLTAIWKVYSICLEYCCRADYKLLITKVTEKYQQEMNEVEHQYKERFDK